MSSLVHAVGGDLSVFSPLTHDGGGDCVISGDDGRLSLTSQLLPSTQQVQLISEP